MFTPGMNFMNSATLPSAMSPNSSVATTFFIFGAKRCSLIARAAALISREVATTKSSSLTTASSARGVPVLSATEGEGKRKVPLGGLSGGDVDRSRGQGKSAEENPHLRRTGGHAIEPVEAAGIAECFVRRADDGDAGVFEHAAGGRVGNAAFDRAGDLGAETHGELEPDESEGEA